VVIGAPDVAARAERGADTRDRIVAAGTKLFAERGYAAASMRHLAERAGVALSASYYYFPGKQDVLVAIMDEAMIRLEGGAKDVMSRGLEPRERLAELVRAHVLVHLEEPELARVADSELRALAGPSLARVVAWRDRYEAVFRKTLAQGVENGTFSASLDVPITAMAIITMATGTAAWWRPNGRLSRGETAAQLSDLAIAMSVR
jgi:AcrR family transcriptional regulator